MGVYVPTRFPRNCRDCSELCLDVVVECYPDEYGEDSDGNKIICPLIKVNEPKIGKWIRITQGFIVEKYACSVCGRIIEDGESEALLFIKYPYCHCGAKMERRSDE